MSGAAAEELEVVFIWPLGREVGTSTVGCTGVSQVHREFRGSRGRGDIGVTCCNVFQPDADIARDKRSWLCHFSRI